MILFVLGICVLCAREEGAHRVCSGNGFQTPGVLQSILWNWLPPKKTRSLHTQTCTFHTVSTCLHDNLAVSSCFFLPFMHLTMIPFSFGRLGSHPRLSGRSHGELGAHHFQRDQPAGGQTVLFFGKTSGGLHHSSRAGSSGSFYFCEWNVKYDPCAHLFLMLFCSGLETW